MVKRPMRVLKPLTLAERLESGWQPTVWTKEQDDQLLKLGKLLPNQWVAIAPLIGHGPMLCIGRYEKLLADIKSDVGPLHTVGAEIEDALELEEEARLRTILMKRSSALKRRASLEEEDRLCAILMKRSSSLKRRKLSNSFVPPIELKQVKALLKDRLNGKTGGGSSEKKSGPSASVELTSRNFDELVIKSKDLWIVEFFAPWCRHCKKLAPEWKKAANNLKGKVKLGHVNCDDEKSLMNRFSVQGFPTILVFGADKESPIPFQGARTASAIESFALEQLETNAAPPEVTELTSPDVMEEKCGSAAICFVSFLPDILDTKAGGRNKYLEMLLSVAEKFKRSPYSFVWAAAGKQADLEKQVDVGGYGYPAMVAFNAKKGAYAPLKSAYELDHIVAFVKEAGLGGKGNLPMSGTPKIEKIEPWDGKGGEVIEEEEFSLMTS